MYMNSSAFVMTILDRTQHRSRTFAIKNSFKMMFTIPFIAHMNGLAEKRNTVLKDMTMT